MQNQIEERDVAAKIKETEEEACALYWSMQVGSMNMYYGEKCANHQPIGIWLPEYHPSPGGCATADPDKWCTLLEIMRKKSPKTGNLYAHAFADSADANYPGDGWSVPVKPGVALVDELRRKCQVGGGSPRGFRLIELRLTPPFFPEFTIRFGIELEGGGGGLPGGATQSDQFGDYACCIHCNGSEFDVITRYEV